MEKFRNQDVLKPKRHTLLAMYPSQYAHYASRFKDANPNQTKPNTKQICRNQLKPFRECKTDVTCDFTSLNIYNLDMEG